MPLEPVIEAVGREIARGRVRALGVRNWTADRAKALPGVAAIITTELSLAAATGPLWPEYVPFDAELRQVVCDLGVAVFAHADDINLGQSLYEDGNETASMRRRWLRRWEHPGNPGLVQRVRRLAAARGFTPREMNVAWLLNQPFPSIAAVSLSLLTAHGAEYERASGLVLGEDDLDFLSGSPWPFECRLEEG
jgi:aryl-alcohol dehydrogenase-like predicted oxidoreductase